MEEGGLATVTSSCTKVRQEWDNPKDSTLKMKLILLMIQLKLKGAGFCFNAQIERNLILILSILDTFREDIFSSIWRLSPLDRTITRLKEIKTLIQRFSKPMKASGFQKLKFDKKWCSFQTIVNLLFQYQKYQKISERTITYCPKGFCNIYVLAMKLSSPNNLFKKVLTILTTVLGNWCQNMIYKTTGGYNLIVRNKKIWSEKEKDEL